MLKSGQSSATTEFKSVDYEKLTRIFDATPKPNTTPIEKEIFSHSFIKSFSFVQNQHNVFLVLTDSYFKKYIYPIQISIHYQELSERLGENKLIYLGNKSYDVGNTIYKLIQDKADKRIEEYRYSGMSMTINVDSNGVVTRSNENITGIVWTILKDGKEVLSRISDIVIFYFK